MDLYSIIQLVQLIIADILILILELIEIDWDVYQILLFYTSHYILLISVINLIVYIVSFLKNRSLPERDDFFLLIVPGAFIILVFTIFSNFFHIFVYFLDKGFFSIYKLIYISLILAVACPLAAVFALLNKKISDVVKAAACIVFPFTSAFIIYKLAEGYVP